MGVATHKRRYDHLCITDYKCRLIYLFCMQRDQLHQQEALVSSLQQQLKRVSEGQSVRQQQQLAGPEELSLSQENSRLRDDSARLREELCKTQERNKRLEEVSNSTPFIVVL